MTRKIFQLSTVVLLIVVCFFSIYSATAEKADAPHPFTPCKDSSLFSDEQFLENAVGGGPAPDGIPPA